MPKRRYALSLAAVFCSLCCSLAHASSLTGSAAAGSLTFTGDPSNYFDPGYGFVPPTGYLNTGGTTVTVSASAVEFGFDDGASLISADLSSNQIVIRDLIEISGATNAFQLSFTDPALLGQIFTLSSGSAPPSNVSLVGSTLTVDYAGRTVTAGQNFTSTVNLTPVPEPSTLTFALTSLATGAAVVAGSRRRRHGFHV